MRSTRSPRRAGAALFLVVFAVGCASDAGRPWHIPKGREGRFREANRVCHQLTDADDGTAVRERFESCMKRRGWRKERWTDRLGFNLGNF